ncbi:peptidylprolyl isomerase [Paenibacillus sp. 1011MAR3C5]|uniref:peptidylprolyl isomerase n=1 Tax=Paenibacillus sp. 1011MAR3C5 TaxID=1675787 RepID=UPI000E6B9197|nr:peptidylprolyl isomerase [Paenibacillus sp. 1011MAR3C5]RJE90157.1 peptidylprolyl isomerase [Paenibacillus sp. 1011MAR3C5]
MSIRGWGTFRNVLVVIAFMLLVAGCGAKGNAVTLSDGKSDNGPIKAVSWDRMPQMSIDLDKQYKAKIATSKGEFVVELYAKAAPVTVNNFVFLSNEGFYEGLKFHSIIESFMIQTGDPKGNGTGNAGYRIPDELSSESVYEEGTVAMFNTGAPNSGSSQFFICTGPEASNLNRQPNYTIFGKVVSGMDTVRLIASSPVENGSPIEDIIIESVNIETV